VREREKLGEWRDPDNEVFTIFTVEKWNIANDRTTVQCVSFRNLDIRDYIIIIIIIMQNEAILFKMLLYPIPSNHRIQRLRRCDVTYFIVSLLLLLQFIISFKFKIF